MYFQAQNPTASDFPLPSVPSKTVVQSMSLRTNQDCKFIQLSFSPDSSFSTFQHTDLLCIKAPPRHQNSALCPGLHHGLQLSVLLVRIWGPTAKHAWSVVPKLFSIYSQILHPVTDAVSVQIKLPAVFTSTFAFFLSDWICSISPLEKMPLFTFSLNLSISIVEQLLP